MKICICVASYNDAIRILLYLAYNTDTWMLGPLLGQAHIGNQLYVRIFFS